MHVLTLLWLALSACRPLEAANCTANHMYSNKNTLNKKTKQPVCSGPPGRVFCQCVHVLLKLCKSAFARCTSSAKSRFHSFAPSAPERVREGAAAGAAQKLTSGQTRQIGQVERRGNHKLVRNAKSAHANFSQATTPLFCEGQRVRKLPLHAQLLSYLHNLARESLRKEPTFSRQRVHARQKRFLPKIFSFDPVIHKLKC